MRGAALGIPHAVGDPQRLRLPVEQVDRERVELDEAANQVGNARQEGVEVEHLGDLAAQVEQRRQPLAVGGAHRRRRRRGNRV